MTIPAIASMDPQQPAVLHFTILFWRHWGNAHSPQHADCIHSIFIGRGMLAREMQIQLAHQNAIILVEHLLMEDYETAIPESAPSKKSGAPLPVARS